MQADNSEPQSALQCDICPSCEPSERAASCPEPVQTDCCAVVAAPPRPERLFDATKLPRYLCGQPACNVFGGHDYYPEETAADECGATVSNRRRGRNPNVNSLGSPVGVVKSTFAMHTLDTSGDGEDMGAQRFATYLKAFAMIYLTPENEWDSSLIDTLLREGQMLYTFSMADAADDEVLPRRTVNELAIYTEEESKINREFELNGFVFGVELSEKFAITNPMAMLARHATLRSDFTVEQLRPALKGFFRRFKYCLMRISSWYVLIWKTRSIFFVFDFYGRRPNDFLSDREGGVAMLICLKSLDNVLHLLQNLSKIEAGEPIQLREMKVVKLSGPDGKTVNRDFGRRANQFVVVSADYAYLTSAFHLNRQQREPLRSRSALPIAVAALITAKIDHPATWNRTMLEKIICFGVNMCQYCWEQCQYSRMPLEIERFPSEMKLGQFLTRYTLTPRVLEGVWKCVPNYTLSELVVGLEKCFDSNMTNLLIQIGSQIYAFWKKHGYFYLLDPYRHRIGGALLSADMMKKSASVRMFRTMDGFMGVFTQILLEYTKTSPFQIHSLKVNRLQYVEKPEGKPALIEEVDGDDEVVSLNETICFEEDSAKCKKLLTDITEDDDEEEMGGALELDLKEPKSDSEQSAEDLEEEEGGMEGMGEYETSSSGDDEHGHKRQGGGGGGGGSGGGGGAAQRQPGGSDRVNEHSSKSTGSGSGSGRGGSASGSGSRSKGGKSSNGKSSGSNGSRNNKAAATDNPSGQPVQTVGVGTSAKQSHRRFGPLSRLFSVFTMCRPHMFHRPTNDTHVFSLPDENCNYPDMLKELRAAFKYANRLEVHTPWACYDIYRAQNVKQYDSVYICQENAYNGDGCDDEEEYFFNVQDVTRYMIGVQE